MADMGVAAGGLAGKPPTDGSDAVRHWQAVHGAGDLQFAPLPPYRAEPTPQWLEALGRWLRAAFQPLARLLHALFEPLGRLIGISWPVMQWIGLGLLALGVLAGAAWLARPLLGWRPAGRANAPDWAPDAEAARALLGDAELLASQARYDEAVHLLLQRSVAHIEAARPGWLHPAATAREIASHPALPDRARAAFALIAGRVERSRYALRPLAEADWQAAREAYAAFALQSLAAA